MSSGLGVELLAPLCVAFEQVSADEDVEALT